ACCAEATKSRCRGDTRNAADCSKAGSSSSSGCCARTGEASRNCPGRTAHGSREVASVALRVKTLNTENTAHDNRIETARFLRRTLDVRHPDRGIPVRPDAVLVLECDVVRPSDERRANRE